MSEQKKLKLGYNTAGTEEAFENRLRQAIQERTTAHFRYLELGIAEGTTLVAVANLLLETIPHDWQAVGLDLFGGAFFNPVEFLKKSLAFNTVIEFEGRCTREPYVADRITADIRILLLKSDSKRALVSPGCINFCLIDGCHGAPCVEKDFLSIEAGMAKGGIVAFHDAGLEDQGIHFQQHCQMPISVREALDKLGLGPNAVAIQFNEETGVSSDGCRRPGWKCIGHVDGDKSPGNLVDNGHGFIFFQKL